MTELTRYLTLAGVLFGIGIYGLLTRRSQTGILISLGVTVGAIALVFVVPMSRPTTISSIALTPLQSPDYRSVTCEGNHLRIIPDPVKVSGHKPQP